MLVDIFNNIIKNQVIQKKVCHKLQKAMQVKKVHVNEICY